MAEIFLRVMPHHLTNSNPIPIVRLKSTNTVRFDAPIPEEQPAETEPNEVQASPPKDAFDGKKRRSRSIILRNQEQAKKNPAKATPAKRNSKGEFLSPTLQANTSKQDDSIDQLQTQSSTLNSSRLQQSPGKEEQGTVTRKEGMKTTGALKSLFKKSVNMMSMAKRITSYDLENISNEDLIELVITILQKPLQNRGSNDYKALLKYMLNIDFFKDKDNEDKTVEKCVRKMYYCKLQKGQTVFEIDSDGTTFWVILKGTVSVWIHEKKEVKNKKGEIEEQKILIKVRELPAGVAFGELALITNKPRLATIICEQECQFAVLDKASFTEILRDSEQRKLNLEIEFLSLLPMFKNWSYHAVKNLYSYLGIVKLKRGHVLYSEGDPSQKMYIIKSGEFKVSKLVEFDEGLNFELKGARAQVVNQQPVKRNIDVAILGVKELIGGEEFFENAKRKYKVECTKEGELYEFSKKEFFNPKLTFYLSSKWLSQDIIAKKQLYEGRINGTQKAQKGHGHFLVYAKENAAGKSEILSRNQVDSFKDQFNANTLHLEGFKSRDQSADSPPKPKVEKAPAHFKFTTWEIENSMGSQKKEGLNPLNGKPNLSLSIFNAFFETKKSKKDKNKATTTSLVDPKKTPIRQSNIQDMSSTVNSSFQAFSPVNTSAVFIERTAALRNSRQVSLTPERMKNGFESNDSEKRLQNKSAVFILNEQSDESFISQQSPLKLGSSFCDPNKAVESLKKRAKLVPRGAKEMRKTSPFMGKRPSLIVYNHMILNSSSSAAQPLEKEIQLQMSPGEAVTVNYDSTAFKTYEMKKALQRPQNKFMNVVMMERNKAGGKSEVGISGRGMQRRASDTGYLNINDQSVSPERRRTSLAPIQKKKEFQYSFLKRQKAPSIQDSTESNELRAIMQ